MAVITISRQVAALGDEIAMELSKKTGYKFITRKDIEKRIVELGFSEKKLNKYDERKPGFFASLTKDRDEYLNYLQYAVLEAARDGNVILIGRGTYIILDEVPGVVSVRFVAKNEVRMKRLMEEFNWNEKQAMQRITESDANRRGFNKSFFNQEESNPENFVMTLNTGILSLEEAVVQLEYLIKQRCSEKTDAACSKRIENLLKCQKLLNALLFEHKLNINFLHADINEEGNKIVLHGVADSKAVVDHALHLSKIIQNEAEVTSAISVVQDFKK